MDWSIIAIAGLVGSAAFALSGFLAGVRKHLDAMGIFIVSMLTANGGGALRDVLVNKVPLVLQNATPFLISLAIVALGWVLRLHRRTDIERHGLFVLCDAIGLAAFSVTGAMAGIEAGLPMFGVMVLAFLTATGGGILRDVLLGEVPALLSSDFYGTVALLVAAGMLLLDRTGTLQEWTITVLLVGALGIRLLAYKQRWQLPRLRPPAE